MRYFELREFESSQSALELGIDNRMPFNIEQNIESLVSNILDPAREKLGHPIIVTSGYRCKELNDHLVKHASASANSLHQQGRAADITSLHYNEELLAILKKLPCFELIVYRSKFNGTIRWMHVSYLNGTRGLWFSKFV